MHLGVGLNTFWLLPTPCSNMLVFCFLLIVLGMMDCFVYFVGYLLNILNCMFKVKTKKKKFSNFL